MSEEIKTEEQEESGSLEETKAKLEAMMEGGDEEEESPIASEDPAVETDPEPEEDPEPKPEEDGDPEPKEDPEPETEPESKPDNAAFARLRHQKKELERQLAEATKKPDPTNESASTSVDKLVDTWESGNGDESAHLTSIRKADSSELAALYQKALNGDYGDYGDDVISMIQREMPMIQEREKQEQASAVEHNKAVAKAMQDEMDMAKSDYPDYAKEDSEASKHMGKFTATVLGTLDPETGELDGKGVMSEELAMYFHTHPYAKHQLADLVFKASQTHSDTAQADVAVLQKENDSLKSRLSKYEDLSSPTASHKSHGAQTGSAAEAKEKLMALMGAKD